MSSSVRRSEIRKHSKTFTGCWTCRARKVKCDETRPGCSQCRHQGIACGGYHVRLQWMPPFSHDAVPQDSATEPIKPANGHFQRRRVAFEPDVPPLPSQQVDEILDAVDTMVPKQPIGASNYSRTSTIRYWGVFDAGGKARRHPSPRAAPCSVEPHFLEDFGTDVELDKFSHDYGRLPVEGQESVGSVQTRDETPIDLEVPVPLVEASFSPVLDSPTAFESYAYDLQPIRSSHEDCVGVGNDRKQLSLFEACGTIYKSPMPVNLSRQERFLLYHYSHRVVNLFCVLGNPKTPWKLVHLPKVVQSVGELSISGSITRIRAALKSSLLSISAFCIANDHKNRQEDYKASHWCNEAILLRGKAIQLLKLAVEHDFNPKSAPRYKDFLATMLSMISINVMSGDTASCALHLAGIAELIRHAKKWKTRYSFKAHALHRTFFYLQTIHQSTVVPPDEYSVSPGGEPELFSGSLSPVPSGSTPLHDLICEETSPESEHSVGQMVTFQGIYGVPQSLVIILSKVTCVIHSLDVIRRTSGSAMIPMSMTTECDELEHEIMNWSAEALPEDHPIRSTSINADIIRLTTTTFHNAIVIYFAQNVRLVGHHYLRPFVREVLDSIEAIENIKAQAKTLAAPLFWPAFIAASESFDEKLRQRFRAWYKRVEMYGFECPRTGIEILVKIWESGNITDVRTTSRWREAVRTTQSVLMLT